MHDYMVKLSHDLKFPLHNNCILIPPSKGTGFIKNILLEQGFCIRYYHFRLHEDLLFNWFLDSSNVDPVFKLVFTLPSYPAEQEAIGRNEADYSTVLYSTDFVRTNFIQKDTWVNRLVLMFTKQWLADNFIEASNKIAEMVTILLTKNKPTFISEIMQQSHYMCANEIAREMNKEAFPIIHIKTRSLILLNDFLNKIVERDVAHLSANQTLYYSEITKVEKKLNEYLDKPMPCISTLAQEFNMSESTLKRHFKIVYGKSVYHYHLEKKLAIGKEMIAAKNKTVSEIAYMLGYNKINSFSKVFKKYYGVLPKDINAINSFY